MRVKEKAATEAHLELRLGQRRLEQIETATSNLMVQGGGANRVLEQLLDPLDEAVFVVDGERNLLAFNRMAELLTGFRREEVLGRHCLTGIKCARCLESCGIFKHGKIDNVPLELYRADGQLLDIRKSAVVLRDGEGQVIGAIEVFRAAREAQQVEFTGGDQGAAGATAAALQQSGQQLLEQMMCALGRAWLVLDADFVVQQVSPLFAKLLDREPRRLLGLPAESLLGSELFGPRSSFRLALETGQRREGWRAQLARSLRPKVGSTGEPAGAPGKPRAAQAGAAGNDPIAVSVTAAPFEGLSELGSRREDLAGPEGMASEPRSDTGRVAARQVLVIVRPEPRTESMPQEGALRFEGMVARSPQMRRVFELIEHLHESDASVLITGASGTGKELVARAVHARSLRANAPFVAINCGALPGELLESELFGHARGAFTGALRDKAGRFEVAGEGTVFLDEIGDLPLLLQVKLLRVLQEREFERVGETHTRAFKGRIVAATNRDLVLEVRQGRFREDLFYRLNVVPIWLPPLCQRREDLELIIYELLERIGQRRGRALRLAPPVMRALLGYDWPGNVRQLENALEYAIAVCDGQTIHREDLPFEVWGVGPGLPTSALSSAPPSPPLRPLPPEARNTPPAAAAGDTSLIEGEEALSGTYPSEAQLRSALRAAHGRKGAAAAALGISRTTLWRRLRALND